MSDLAARVYPDDPLIPEAPAGVLQVHAIHQDVPFTTAMTEAVGREIEDLARWFALDLTTSRPSRRSRSLIIRGAWISGTG